jgi:hypothetical protein
MFAAGKSKPAARYTAIQIIEALAKPWGKPRVRVQAGTVT